MKKVFLTLKFCLLLFLGLILCFSLLMFPSLLFGDSQNPATLRIGYGYLAVFVLSGLGFYTIIKRAIRN